jgi:hypothetical protein
MAQEVGHDRRRLFLGSRAATCHIRHVANKSLHPYVLKTRSCTEDAGRFRWEILDSDGVLNTSWVSFATEQEANESGRREMQSLVEMWNKR